MDQVSGHAACQKCAPTASEVQQTQCTAEFDLTALSKVFRVDEDPQAVILHALDGDAVPGFQVMLMQENFCSNHVMPSVLPQ